MPLSLSASYCFSFLTFAFLLGTFTSSYATTNSRCPHGRNGNSRRDVRGVCVVRGDDDTRACVVSVRLRIVLGVRVLRFRIRNGRLVELVVSIVLARMHILL